MKLVVETNVAVTTRDGVDLASDVYRPDDAQRHPVLLCRTPYGKDAVQLSGGIMNPPVLTWAQRGYVVVVQDCRGTGKSTGEFRFYVDEGSDGVDTIEWCAVQPWSSGKVGMFGASYLSTTQFTAAIRRPAALKALAPSVAPAHYYGELAYRGGALALGCALEWTMQQVTAQRARGSTLPSLPALPASPEMFARTPLTDVPELSGTAGEHYRTWLAHPNQDEYWDALAYRGSYAEVAVPTLHIGGWYDVFLDGTIANYLNLRDSAATPEARAHQQLVIGPWTHTNQTGAFAGRGYGPAAMEPAGVHELQFEHFDRWLDDKPGPATEDLPVRIFVMGIDRWRAEGEWPLARTTYRELYLHGSPAADDRAGEGALSFDPPGRQEPRRYVYDPLDPVPTLGGQVLLTGAINEGPVDQRPNDSRRDVLRYVTEPLEEDLEVTGPVTLIAYVSASTPDTDLTGSLIDVHPDGHAELLTDGILRLRYRDSFTSPERLEPGTTYQVEVDLWATANVFRAGHRVRLDISSSNFPRYNRNSNTGGLIAEEREEDMISTTVTIYSDAAHPTHLLIPIIPS